MIKTKIYKSFSYFRMMQLPIYVKPQISFISGNSGRFDLTIGQKANLGKTVSLSSI